VSVIARHVLAGRLADAAAVAVIARHVLAGRLADAVVSNLQRFEAPNCLPFLTRPLGHRAVLSFRTLTEMGRGNWVHDGGCWSRVLK
jgi:hypothetical protein